MSKFLMTNLPKNLKFTAKEPIPGFSFKHRAKYLENANLEIQSTAKYSKCLMCLDFEYV